ncbi:MAG: PRC-barrel domain-containing protein [Rhodothermales bacterium]
MDESRRHSEQERKLRPIDKLDDIQVAEGDPDVRGWDVLTRERLRIGKVHTLIVDEAAMTVRYLGIAVNDDLLVDRDSHHVLIPIGMARLDPDHDNVLFDDVTPDDVMRLPNYEHGPVTPEYEARVRDVLITEGEPYGSSGYYDQEYFDRDRFYRRERNQTRPATGSRGDVRGRTGEPDPQARRH